MPNGTTYNLPNYAGELFTADMENTPFLSMIGGMGGGKQTENEEFPVGSSYTYPAAKQPTITENESFTAPDATIIARDQSKNVTQIFQESINISYRKLSNRGRMSGLNTAGQANNAPNEKDFQISKHLIKMARDIEYTIFNGEYNKAASADEADQTRGLLELLAANTTIDASGAALSKDLLDSLFLAMFTAGATFENMVMWGPAAQIKLISDIYGYAPTDRTIGGTNIRQIVTTYGNIGVAEPHRFIPNTTIALVNMSAVDAVFQPTPEKGNFFYEELARTGASEKGQLYGQFGLDHGLGFMHGSITGLAV